jgi:cholesterol oxidase
MWPNKGEVDQRPAQGIEYKYLAPIKPVEPVVPASAYGALNVLPLEIK